MKVKDEVLLILEQNLNLYNSGSQMALDLKVSRNAIWKAINELKSEGYEIVSKNPGGYKLLSNKHIVSKNNILSKISNKNVRLEYLEEVSSTNDYLKNLLHKDLEQYYCVISKNQSRGKGRNGKSFYSPNKTGVYFSILLRPDFNINKSLLITTATAVAMCKTIEEFSNKYSSIKWVNDIFIGDKKVCGILTEGSFDFDKNKLSHVIVGVGVNLFKPLKNFPLEIQNSAGYILKDYNPYIMEDFIASMINSIIYHYENIDSKEIYEYYREKSYLNNKEVRFLYKGELVEGLVIDVDESFNLVINKNKEKIHLSSGSVEVI
ncbi:MAG: biotin--[acetyl-CoA-carboxylase] ligase [Lagierella massiliensis]|nr:biotin--[acetyl-CoA-carboxylase] ligase [Lagierella massiliensis]